MSDTLDPMVSGNFGNTRRSHQSRVNRAVELRRAGYTTAEIVEKIPEYQEHSKPNWRAQKDIEEALQEVIQTPAKQLLALQVYRLEGLLSAVYETALEGDIPAHKQALATLEQQSKLLGVGNLPSRGEGSDIDSWLNSMLGTIEEASAADIEDEPDEL